MAKTYGVQVYSPTRALPVRTQGQLANSQTAGRILNPTTPSMARPQPMSFSSRGTRGTRAAQAPAGVPQNIFQAPQVGQQQGNFSGYGQSFGPTPLDLMRANRPVPQEQPNAFSGGFFSDIKGALGVAANTLPGKAVLGALNVMDMPRRAVISTIHEISDALGSGDASWSDWKDQFNDPSYGVGKYVDTGNWLVDDILGFAGDVLLDPMTYVAGSGVLAGVGRSTRLEAAAAATAAGFADDVVDQIGRRGVGFLDNAQRKLLREATNTAGEHIGVNVLDRGYYLRLGLREPVRIPGTGSIERVVGAPFARTRSALAQSNLGSYLRARALDPLDQTEAIERLITGKGRMSASEAGERLNMTAGYRAGRGTARTTMRDGAASLIRDTPGGNDSLNAMINAAERVGNTPINEYFGSGATIFENAGGVWQRGPRERYVPHFTTEGAQNWMDGSSQAARDFRAGIIPGTTTEQVSPQMLERQLVAGREYQFGGRQVKNATTGEMEWVGGRKMKVTDGTIDGLNEAFAEAFPETRGQFKLFEDDFQRIAAHYSESLAEDVGRLTGFQRLARSRSGLIRSIDDVSDWKINKAETAVRYGEVSKELKTQLAAKNDTVAQLRAAASQQVHSIQGVMGVHMQNAIDGLQTASEPLRAELTDLLQNQQRLEKLVGGTTGVKGGPAVAGEMEVRLNEELGRLTDRETALTRQIDAIAPQAAREREQYLAAMKATENASLANASRNTPTYDEWNRLIHERAATQMDTEALSTVRNQLRNARTKVAKIDQNVGSDSFLNLVAGPQWALPAKAEGEISREIIPNNFDPATGQMLSPEKSRRLIGRPMTEEEQRVAGITPSQRSPAQVRTHYNARRRDLLRGSGIGHSDEIDAATVQLSLKETARDNLASSQGKIIAQARERYIEALSTVQALRHERSEIQGDVSLWADVAELDMRIAEEVADDGNLGMAAAAYAEAKRPLDAANEEVTNLQNTINNLRNRQLAEARGKDEQLAERAAYRLQRRDVPEEAVQRPDIQAEVDRLTNMRDREAARRRSLRSRKAQDRSDELYRSYQTEIDRLTNAQRPRADVEQVALGPPPERLPLTSAQAYDAETKLRELRAEHAEWARSEDAGHIARAQRDIAVTDKRLTSIDRNRTPITNASNRVRIDENGNYRVLNPNAVSQELVESREEWESLRRIAQTERDQSQAMIYKADRGMLDEDEAMEAVHRFMRADDDLNALDRQVDGANARLRDDAYHGAPPAIEAQRAKLAELDDEAARLRRARRQLDRFETLTGRKARQRANQIDVLSEKLTEQADAARRIYRAAHEEAGVMPQTWEQRVRQLNTAEDNALSKSYTTGKPIKTEWEALDPVKGDGARAFPQERAEMGRVDMLSPEDRTDLEDAYRVARHTPRRQRTRDNALYQEALSTIKEIEGARRPGISNHEAQALSEWSAVRRRIDAASAGYNPPSELTEAMKAASKAAKGADAEAKKAAKEAAEAAGKKVTGGDTTVAGRAKKVLDSADLITDDKLDKLVTSGAIPNETAADFYDTMNRLSEVLDEYQRRPNPANHADIDYLVQRGAWHVGVFNNYGLALDLGIEPSPELGAFLLREETHKQLRVVKAQLGNTETQVASGVESKAWADWDASIKAQDDIISTNEKFIAQQKEIKRATGAYTEPQEVGNARKRINGAKNQKARLRAKPPKDFNEYQDALDMMFDNMSKEFEDFGAAINDYNMMRRLPKEIEKPAELRDRLTAKIEYDAANIVQVRAENARLRSAVVKAMTEGKDTVRYSPNEVVRETFWVPELRQAIEEGQFDPATAQYAEYLAGKETAAQRKARSIAEGNFTNPVRKNVSMTPAATKPLTYATEPVANFPFIQGELARATESNDQQAMRFWQQQLDQATEADWARAREAAPERTGPQRAPRGGPAVPTEHELQLRGRVAQLEAKRLEEGINQAESQQLRSARSQLDKMDADRMRAEMEPVLPVEMRQPRQPQQVVVSRKQKGKLVEVSLEQAQRDLKFSTNMLETVTNKNSADRNLLKMLNGDGQRELDEITARIENATLAGELADPADIAQQAKLQEMLTNFKETTFGAQEHIDSVMDGGIRMLRDLTQGTRQIQPSDLPILRDLFGGFFEAELASTYIERFNNMIERFSVSYGERRNVRSLGDLQQDFNAFMEEVRLTLGDNAFTDNVENDVRQLMQSRMDDAMREAGDVSYEDPGIQDWAGEGQFDTAEQVGGTGEIGPQNPMRRTPTDVIGKMRDDLFGALVAARNDSMKAAKNNAIEQAQLLGIATGSMDSTSLEKLGYSMSKEHLDRGKLRDVLRQRWADMGLDPRNALPERERSLRARYAQLSMIDHFLGGSVTTSRMRDPEAFFIALSQLEQSGGTMADRLKLFDRFNVPEEIGAVDAQHLANLRAELAAATKSKDPERIAAAQEAVSAYEAPATQGTGRAKGKARAEAVAAKPKVDESGRHAAQVRINKADEEIAAIDEHMAKFHGETLDDLIAEGPRPPVGTHHTYTKAEVLRASRQAKTLSEAADAIGTQEARQAGRDARARALTMADNLWTDEPEEFVKRADAIDEAMKKIGEMPGDLPAQRARLVAEREAAQEALNVAEGIERKAAVKAGKLLNDADLAAEFASASEEFHTKLQSLGNLSEASADDVAQLNELGDRLRTLSNQRDENIRKAKAAGVQGNELYQQYQAVQEGVGELRGKSDVAVDWLELMHAGLPNQSTIRGLAHKQAEGLGRRGPERYVLGSLMGDRVTPEARGYLGGMLDVQRAASDAERAPITRAREKLLGQKAAAEERIGQLSEREAQLTERVGDPAARDARIAQLEQEDAARVAQQVDDLRQAQGASEHQHAVDMHTMYEARRRVAAEKQRVQDRYTQNLTEMKMQLGDARKAVAVAGDSLKALDDMTEATRRAAVAAHGGSAELKPLLDDLAIVNQLRRDQVLLDTGAEIGQRRVPGRGPEGPAMIDIGEENAIRYTEGLLNSAADAVMHLADQEFEAKMLKDRVDQFAKGAGDVAPVLERVVHDGWVQMAKDLRGDANSLGVATGLADAIKNLSEALRQPESWKLIDQYTNFFKTYATMTPGFHVRNAMSAVFMNFVDGVRGRHMVQAMPLWHEFAQNPLRFMESLETRPNGAKIRAAFQAVLGSGAGGQFVEKGVAEAGSMTSAAYQRLMHNTLTKWNTRFGSYVEGTARLGMALDTIERGGSLNQALARITKFHFDYTQVSKMDRTMKRFIPFWTFVSRNLPLQIEQMWMRPRTYLQYRSFVRNFSVTPNPFTPDYWLAQGAFTMDPNAATAGDNDAPWYLAPDLPFTRVTEPIDALVHGDLGKALLSDVNPLFAAPIEAYAAHRKFYTGAPIEGYSEPHGAMSWLTPIFDLLGQTETGGTTGHTLVSNSAQHMARTLNPILNLAERLTSEGDDNSVRTGRRDETLYRALGAPVYQLTPQVRESTRKTRYYARRDAAQTQAELARS